jgi:hypothetical protein
MADGSVNEIVRGEEARLLLENPLLVEAFESVRKGIVSGMTSSAMGDEKTHNRLVIALQLLHQIEKQLKDHVDTGKMAQIQVKESLVQRMFNR